MLICRRRIGLFVCRNRDRNEINRRELRRRQIGAAALAARHAAHHTIVLLDLQVGEAPHRFGRQLMVRRRVQELSVTRHRADEAVVDRYFLQIRLDVTKLGDGAALVARRLTADEKESRSEYRRRASHSTFACCCVAVARS